MSIFLNYVFPFIAGFLIFLYFGMRTSRRRRFYKADRYEINDITEVLSAALASNPTDAKVKIAYAVEELRKLT
jgi:hypothetical protein